MCEPRTPFYRDPDLRRRAAELRAADAEIAVIARELGVSDGTVQRLLAPLPPLDVDPPPRPSACRNCGRAKVSRPRGLCWSCYYTPGVKAKFPCTSKHAHRGVGGQRPGRRPLPVPTTAPPGSPEKIAVLARRAEREEQLWHPSDAGW